MANNNNLIPQAHKLTVEEQSKGGQISAEKRRQNKSWNELLTRLGDLPIESEEMRELMGRSGLTDEEMVSDMQKLYQLNRKADTGDLKAIELIAKIRGQLRADDLLLNSSVESVVINFRDKKIIEGEEG